MLRGFRSNQLTILCSQDPLDAEAGIFCSSFDQTGTRLITGCADKSTYVPSNSSDQNLSRNVDRSGNCMVLNELDSRGRQIWSKHR